MYKGIARGSRVVRMMLRDSPCISSLQKVAVNFQVGLQVDCTGLQDLVGGTFEHRFKLTSS